MTTFSKPIKLILSYAWEVGYEARHLYRATEPADAHTHAEARQLVGNHKPAHSVRAAALGRLREGREGGAPNGLFRRFYN